MVPQHRHDVPLNIQIESLFHQWIDLLRDYSRATGEWKNMLKEDLWDIYLQMNSFKDVEGVEHNAYFTLITNKDFDQHLQLSTRNTNVIRN